MSGGAGADGFAGGEAFRRWAEAQSALFKAAQIAPLWARAEMTFQAWARFVESLAEAHGARHGGPDASPFDPAGWLRPEGAGGMADLLRWMEGPDIAEPRPAIWEGSREAIRGMREWLAYAAAVEQLKTVTAEAWIAAFRRFVEALAEPEPEPEAEAGPGDWQALAALWSRIAGAETAALMRRPAYLAAVRDLMAAETALRRGLRARIETVSELVGLPTRAEIDDLRRTVDGLRRELRRLKRTDRAGDAP